MISAFDEAGIDWIVVVPSSHLNDLYRHFQKSSRCIFATREEEAVAIASGLKVAGAFPVVVMQQSGVGNALNAVFTLSDAYKIHFPIVVIDRGLQDDNPVQRVSSRETRKVLDAINFESIDWDLGSGANLLLAAMNGLTRWIVSGPDGS